MGNKPPRKNNKNTNKRKGRTPRPPSYDPDKINRPPRKRNAPEPAQPVAKKDIRLNRFIANAGICSRREADKLIARGNVQINGKVVTELGVRVRPEDEVRYKGKVITREKPVYILLNKPKDVITTTDDPQGRKTVLDLLDEAARERIYPVGRLDRHTTGLLLLTNDGELAKKLTHPSHEIPKIYKVELDKPIEEKHFQQLLEGVTLEDGKIKPDALAVVSSDSTTLGVDIHSGRNRIVRRMFEHFGYRIQKLDRTAYAGLTKGNLARGQWRFLQEKEVVRLKFMIGKP